MRTRRFGISRHLKTVWLSTLLVLAFILSVISLRAQDAVAPDATGEQIFRAACATCHAIDGKGSPPHLVGFSLPLANGHTLPDFSDCPTNSAETLPTWMAIVRGGGPARGLDRHMPAFGDGLTPAQIE